MAAETRPRLAADRYFHASNASRRLPTAAMAEHEAGAAPSSDAGKRKADEGQSTSKQTKKARLPPPLVTLKNSRLTLRQKNVGWDRTMPVLRGT